ncbi:hypothetical protein EOB59_05470 [Mesorhizobium sp. M7A.F.Ca.MR.176.00.0.0]|uniref:head-tail connector protein n=1 Tax=Mesorhizobium sp. M7A.F.Ca.MR.176.00.0.0 TaxID=2496776 RepID=UPI000FD4BCA9|nr:head-tail connector protein [Mesorhizobium sp. M7A.F.Ca.MR.176.00.0.0]RUU92808.1 hypothetical protein EOB59_05470 [Mesorhizobium sp. M7A.F.Ca.MR.176.00.0.0]
MALVIVTAPSVEPVTLAELKAHVRVDHSDDDSLLVAKGLAARQYVERFVGKPLISTTYDLVLDAFQRGPMQIPKGPLQAVTYVKYVDATSGLETTLATDQYAVDTASDPGWIAPGDVGWPATTPTINAIRVRFIAGYGDAAEDVPMPLREAILQIAAQEYECREASSHGDKAAAIPYGVGDILSEYREWSF